MNKVGIWTGLFALLLLASACEEPAKEEGAEKKPLPNVEAEEVSVETLDHWVELQGTIESAQDVMLTPVMAGTIRRITVEEGQRVRRGQLVAAMDNDVLVKSIVEAEEARNNAFYIWEKQKELMEAGVGNEFEYEQAKNGTKMAQARIDGLRVQAGKAAVFAPFDGVVDEVYPSVGEVGGPGIPICHVIGLKDLRIVASISEAYMKNIGVGSAVKIEVPALEMTFQDTISRVSKYVNPKNRTYKIIIDVDNQDEVLVPNLTVKIKVKDRSAANALIVDNAAIQYDKEGDTHLFKVVRKDTVMTSVLVPVKQILSYNSKTAVEGDGLKQGDMVVVEGAEGIEDGSKVQLMK